METRGRGCGRNHPKVLLVPNWFLPVWKSNIQISLVDTQAEALPEAGLPNSRSPRGSKTRLTPTEQLLELGFDERDIKKALRAFDDDVDRAAEFLLDEKESVAANTRSRGRGDDI